MTYAILNEYTALLAQKAKIESTLSALPHGYLSRKKIGERQYSYLQRRVHGKVKSVYLKANEVASIKKSLAIRDKYEHELPSIVARLTDLEQAAKLLSPSLPRRMDQLKISAGMDDLSQETKQKSVSFSEAMTSIEGVPQTADTKTALENWVSGKTSFLSVLEQTLKKYGFPVEAG